MMFRTALLALAATTAASAQAPASFDLERAPSASGSWTYRPQGQSSTAVFVDTAGIARVTLRCTPAARRVALEATSATPATALSVWTTGSTRALSARFDAATFRAISELAAGDPLLDAIAFTRGRFAVSAGGGVPLVVPAAPEAARVVEDCRI